MRIALLIGVLALSCSPPPGPEGSKGLPANGERIALECEAHGVRAYDASRTLIPGVKLRCTAHAADRRGSPVSGANVLFLTEAGRVDTTGVTATGVVDGVLETSTPLPKDTSPEIFSWTPLNDELHTGELLVPPPTFLDAGAILAGRCGPRLAGRASSLVVAPNAHGAAAPDAWRLASQWKQPLACMLAAWQS